MPDGRDKTRLYAEAVKIAQLEKVYKFVYEWHDNDPDKRQFLEKLAAAYAQLESQKRWDKMESCTDNPTAEAEKAKAQLAQSVQKLAFKKRYWELDATVKAMPPGGEKARLVKEAFKIAELFQLYELVEQWPEDAPNRGRFLQEFAAAYGRLENAG
jgi:benzoyl-CoA reductase/2-hydroxyglutaryl-CoA dehydratase subunit BcrC/BadD/HgdB